MGWLRRLGVAGFFLWAAGIVSATVLVTADFARAQSAGSIVVQGNRRVEADTVRSYFRPGPGGRLDAVRIDEALKALYGTGLFEDVRVSQSGGRLIVTVVENPVINRVAFEGNKKIKDDQLSNEVQSKPRGTLSRATVQSDTQRLVELYRRLGRFDITIDPKIIELPNGRVDLVFEIKEGAKIGVREIRFVGNRAFSSYRLKDVIKTSQSNLLSFLSTTDIYDPDRIEADRDLLRRHYLKRGFIDVRIIAASAEFDAVNKGFIVTYTIDEGQQYRVGAIEVQSTLRSIEPSMVRSLLRVSQGDVFNSEAVEKSVEDMTIEAARRGFSFATMRVRADRRDETRTVNLVFVVEEGSRFYVERINIRGNSRTRDYVIRREFDVAEGDAYNRALINRAERRLKNLNFFKTVKITDEPGSAPDRIVVNVDVEEMSTGDFSVSAGYSTAEGIIGEVSVTERNLLGRGQFAKAAVTYGQRSRGFELSFVEPYFLDYRVALGVDLFARQVLPSQFVSYQSRMIGGNLRAGFQLREDLNFQLRYSVYQQKLELAPHLNDCRTLVGTPGNPFPINPLTAWCFIGNAGAGILPGEASLPIRMELANGAILASVVGYSFGYNTLDNNRNPTMGWMAEVRQSFAGVGGDVHFIQTVADVRRYHEVLPDIIGIGRAQGGVVTSYGGHRLRVTDHFQMGPDLVRGFAPSGIGPRDLTPGGTGDALGGTWYWGASLEFQTPLFLAPKELGLKLAAFADAGSLYDYKGPTFWSVTGERIAVQTSNAIRSSVGVGLVWDSPFGPLRFDYAFPMTKAPQDRVQEFRFSGGTRF